jgi:hypothetical protein
MAGVGLAIVGIAETAHADTMDPALERLVLNRRCIAGGGAGDFYAPTSGFIRCLPNDLAFAKLVAQMGAAIAPIPQYASRTTGFGGFKVGLQGAYTTIDKDAPYWKEGTQGPFDKEAKKFSTVNRSPDSVLQLYSVRLAKGLPFGVEVGAVFGWLANTTIVAGGGDLRISLMEGVRRYVGAYFPDLAVSGGVRTISGTPELKLTVASFDAALSKPFPIAGTIVLQPHLGYQFLRIFGDSGLVDMTPNTEAVQHCGYKGDNTPATPDPSKPVHDGQPYCTGSSADFNNNVVFTPARLSRHRINFGADVRFQMVYLGLNVTTDVVSPAKANPGTVAVPDGVDPSGTRTIDVNPYEDDPRTPDADAVKGQWTIAVEVGAAF